MPIPNYQTVMLPLLKFASDQKEHSIRDAIEHITNLFELTDLERNELLPSGQQAVIDNRVGWARTYLKKAGLLQSTKRSYFQISELGLSVISDNPKDINVKFLEKFPSFIEFRKRKDTEQGFEELEDSSTQTPQELIEDNYQKMRKDLSQELIEQVKICSPRFFEKLVVELLLKMGYGGSLKDAGKAIGKSGDNGIDGIIKEDKLGLDFIYIQAKRWANSVGAPHIREFVGSLAGQNANKGVFITISEFTKEAQEFVNKIPQKVILVDGETLAQFMIDNDVGVSSLICYEIKKVDSDYFIEE